MTTDPESIEEAPEESEVVRLKWEKDGGVYGMKALENGDLTSKAAFMIEQLLPPGQSVDIDTWPGKNWHEKMGLVSDGELDSSMPVKELFELVKQGYDGFQDRESHDDEDFLRLEKLPSSSYQNTGNLSLVYPEDRIRQRLKERGEVPYSEFLDMVHEELEHVDDLVSRLEMARDIEQGMAEMVGVRNGETWVRYGHRQGLKEELFGQGDPWHVIESLMEDVEEYVNLGPESVNMDLYLPHPGLHAYVEGAPDTRFMEIENRDGSYLFEVDIYRDLDGDMFIRKHGDKEAPESLERIRNVIGEIYTGGPVGGKSPVTAYNLN